MTLIHILTLYYSIIILNEVYATSKDLKIKLLGSAELEWSLEHFEYAGDLCLIASSSKHAEQLLQRLKTFLDKYQMETAYEKTV